MTQNLWRQRGLASLGLALFLTSCDEVTDPDPISFQDLKSPGGLSITDNGDGSIQLAWLGSNYEDDFQGYNIYGAKGTATELGVTEGSAIQLLDEEGEPRIAAKEILAKFDYKPDAPFALYGSNTATWLLADDADDDDDDDDGKEKKFSYLPIHTTTGEGDDKEPVLPTCQVTGTLTSGIAACEPTNATTPKDEGEAPLAGIATYDISGLTPGQSYCFFIFSVQDDGEEISQTSSDVRCVVPRLEVAEASVPLNYSASTPLKYKGIDVYNLVRACSGTTCPAFSAHQSTPGSAVSASGGDNTKALYIETYSSTGNLNFVAGKNAALRDLGEMPLGFKDERFKRISANQPAVSFTYDNSANKVRNGGGFSLPYASYVIKAKHMFLLAVADPDATSISAVRYHYIFVNNATDPKSVANAATSLDLTVRYAMADSSCTAGVCQN